LINFKPCQLLRYFLIKSKTALSVIISAELDLAISCYYYYFVIKIFIIWLP